MFFGILNMMQLKTIFGMEPLIDPNFLCTEEELELYQNFSRIVNAKDKEIAKLRKELSDQAILFLQEKCVQSELQRQIADKDLYLARLKQNVEQNKAKQETLLAEISSCKQSLSSAAKKVQALEEEGRVQAVRYQELQRISFQQEETNKRLEAERFQWETLYYKEYHKRTGVCGGKIPLCNRCQ